MEPEVMRVCELGPASLASLLGRRGLRLVWVEAGQAIPGSYWGESEAGLIGNRVYLRPDTPVHSALHEACHWLCMDEARRERVHTDAAGSDVEEHAVCYLQGMLAGELEGYSQARLFADMDAWGYHFRLGGARAFFEQDSEDARAFLRQRGLLPKAAA